MGSPSFDPFRLIRLELRVRHFLANMLYLLFSLFLFLYPATAIFRVGRIMHSENEYREISGRMTVRKAAILCEMDLECAGFTYLGSREMDVVRHIGFYR